MRCVPEILVGLILATAGCDALWTEEPFEASVFDAPIDGLAEEQLRTFHAGKEAFGAAFAPETGLGPVFNAGSCADCHPGLGRGHPSLNVTRFGRGDAGDASTFDYLEELGGPHLQERAIPGYLPEELPSNVAVSERSGTIVVGLGLLEAVPASAILAREDPDDADGDGISGRASFVAPPAFLDIPDGCVCSGCRIDDGRCTVLGRFGRKATTIDLLHQTVLTYHEDIGITTDEVPDDVFNPLVGGPSGDEVSDPEVGSDDVANVVFFLRTLRPPLRRTVADGDVLAGEDLFAQIGCADCHTPRLATGDSAIEPLSGTVAEAYTDLLLHDLGPALADGFPEGGASGREWRTTPLWGLGIVEQQLGGSAFYMHDGRARTLTDAILLHGGEAQAAAERFEALGEADRRRVLVFLRSL
jgi:CxxC motif-containing protein (DUF1111 family)